MNESFNKRGIAVGIFIFLGLIFLLAGILTIGDLHQTFNRKLKLITLFDDVNGLQPGNNIWFSGVKIGTVFKIEFYENSRVKVTMKINTESEKYIRKNAKVKISTDGLIGNKIIVIFGGTALTPAVEDGDTLKVDVSFTSDDMMNTLQESNKNILDITSDFKKVSKRLANGEGTIGQLLTDKTVYTNIAGTTAALQIAATNAQVLTASLSAFSSRLNQKGNLANDLVTDTIVFNSLRTSVLQLQEIADTAKIFISNLKTASSDPKSSVGVLLHDEETAGHLKATIKNLESSSVKLDQDLEALQHNFLLRGFFKKKAKKEDKK